LPPRTDGITRTVDIQSLNNIRKVSKLRLTDLRKVTGSGDLACHQFALGYCSDMLRPTSELGTSQCVSLLLGRFFQPGDRALQGEQLTVVTCSNLTQGREVKRPQTVLLACIIAFGRLWRAAFSRTVMLLSVSTVADKPPDTLVLGSLQCFSLVTAVCCRICACCQFRLWVLPVPLVRVTSSAPACYQPPPRLSVRFVVVL
jgi:hypothetical protein